MAASTQQAPSSLLAATRSLQPYLVVTALFLLVLGLVPPRGNFPLNDDWIYAKVTQHFAETGEFAANPYGDPTFILQAAWGALFVHLFGFSFDTLRLSTLVLSLAGVWGTVWCAREMGVRGTGAALAGAIVLANPMYLNLSYTYMTDVPFIALSVLAGAAFTRGLVREKAAWVLAGSVFSVAAFFIRQFGVLVALAYAAVWIALIARRSRPFRWQEAAAFVGPWIVGFVLLRFLPVGGEALPLSWDWDALGDTLTERIGSILEFLAAALTYQGLFLLPLVAAIALAGIAPGYRPSRRALAGFVTLFVLLLAATAWRWPHRLPYFGNMLYDLGVGPLLLPGMLEGLEIAAPVQMDGGWWAVTILALAAACVFAARAVREATSVFRREQERASVLDYAATFLLLWGLFSIGVLILPPILARFDRYLLMALPPWAVLCAYWAQSTRGRWGVRVATAVVAIGLVFSVVCLQDYLAWNRARWAGLERLRAEFEVPLAQINGGYEFNGWFHSDRFVEESRARGEKVFGPRGWWIVEDDYCVSLRPRDRFEVIGRVPYFSWLGFATRDMLLQRRVEDEEWP